MGPHLEKILLIHSVLQGDLDTGSLQLFAHIHQNPSDLGLDIVSLTPASELLEARGFILFLHLPQTLEESTIHLRVSKMNNNAIYLYRHILRGYVGCKEGYAVVRQIAVDVLDPRPVSLRAEGILRIDKMSQVR